MMFCNEWVEKMSTSGDFSRMQKKITAYKQGVKNKVSQTEL